MTQDQIQTILAAARPLISAIFGILATYGVIQAAQQVTFVNMAETIIGAAIPLAMLIWGAVAHKNQSSLTTTAAQHAFSLGSQDGVVPTAPTSLAAVNAAQVAIQNAKAT